MTLEQMLGALVLSSPLWFCLVWAYRKGHFKAALQGCAWGLGFMVVLVVGSYLMIHGAA